MSKKKLRILENKISSYVEDSNGNLQYQNPPVPENKFKKWLPKIAPFLVVAVAVVLGLSLTSSMSKPVARSLSAYPMSIVLPKGVSVEYVEMMGKLGFGNTETIRNAKYIIERQKWQKDFGLNFIGDAEMKKFLKDNDFIMGNSSQYIDEIPAEAGAKILVNYNRIVPPPPPPSKDEVYAISGTGVITWGGMLRTEEVPPPTEAQLLTNRNTIFVIAGAKKFNTEGMRLVDGILTAIPPVDPIALIKVDHGYVELANW